MKYNAKARYCNNLEVFILILIDPDKDIRLGNLLGIAQNPPTDIQGNDTWALKYEY